MRPALLLKNNTLTWVIRIYNTSGALVDADSTPTVAVRKNGASTGDSVTPTKRSGTTGIYDCSYNPDGEVEGDQFTIEETATVSSTTTSWNWSFMVVDAYAVSSSWTGALATNLATTNTSVATLLTRIIGTLASGTHNPQGGDTFARLGAPAGASIAADIAALVASVLTTAMTESYPTDGSTSTLSQALYLILAHLNERSVSGTTVTLKKLDGSTTAATLTINDANTPTSITRAS